MFQSNGDRWPLWDQEFEADDQADDNKPTERQPGEHKTTDKKISNSKKKQPQDEKFSRQEAIKLASLGTELLAGVLVGTLLGWAISRFVGRGAPWIIAIGVIVGAAAGFLNIYRAIVGLEQKEEQRRRDSSK